MNLHLEERDYFFDQGGNILFKVKSCFLLKLLIKALSGVLSHSFPAKSSGCWGWQEELAETGTLLLVVSLIS